MGGWLTARGVLFATPDEIYEWRPGAAAPRILEGYWNGGDDLQVSKDGRRYGAWPVSRPQGHYRMLRDFVRGTNVLLGNGSVLNVGGDVADNGDAVYMRGPAPYNVFRYRNGQVTRLTASTEFSNLGALTDGINVVYQKFVSSNRSQIVMYSDDLGEIVLRPTSVSFDHFTDTRNNYQPSRGWVAFTRIASIEGGAFRQVWIRSPQGTISRVSPSQSENDHYIHAVHGRQVMFVNASNGYLYLGRPGAAPVLITPFADGTQSLWLQDSWHVYYGGVLYKVVL
jgi:hypothetical protein